MSESRYNGPINPNPAEGESGIIIYGYVPSQELQVVALITYGLALLLHLSNLARLKGTRVFSLLLATCCAFEVIGYGCRLASHYRPFVVNFFIVQYFFIVVAPVTASAAFYLALGQALRRLDRGGRTFLRFNPKILIIVMIIADTVTTIIQIVGAALIGVAESARFRDNGNSPVTSDQANDILLAGLACQTASFLAFVILLGLCIWRSERTFTAHHLPRFFSLVLFAASMLLMLRTTYRLAEIAQGVFGPAYSSEALFGCLEYLPVILAVSAYGFVPLEKQLPIDVEAEAYDSGTSQRSLDMRQTTQEARTIDLRSAGNDSPQDGDLSPVDAESPRERTGYAFRERDEDEGVVSDESPSRAEKGQVDHDRLRN
ncbi:RTA1 domain-containing protein [Rhodotorula paludigena]|uniref:RTA1 domain-containing protein n=1 Tax=Rhodotorula paludigena TaxID=86838 RepID=UPI00317AB928